MERARQAIRSLMVIAPASARPPRRRLRRFPRPMSKRRCAHASSRRPATGRRRRRERESAFDESPVTGESRPIEKGPGDWLTPAPSTEPALLTSGRAARPTARSRGSFISSSTRNVRARPCRRSWIDLRGVHACVVLLAVALAIAGPRDSRHLRMGGRLQHLELPRPGAPCRRLSVRTRDFDARGHRVRAHRRGPLRRVDQGRRASRAAGHHPVRRFRQDRHSDARAHHRHRCARSRRRIGRQCSRRRRSARGAIRTSDRPRNCPACACRGSRRAIGIRFQGVAWTWRRGDRRRITSDRRKPPALRRSPVVYRTARTSTNSRRAAAWPSWSARRLAARRHRVIRSHAHGREDAVTWAS